jgi:mannan endo-1,6-alpha-mannosidase
MYNFTNGSALWEQRINDIIGATDVFYVKTLGANNPPQLPQGGGTIMCEVACERQTPQSCNQDEPSFKAYTFRWLAVTTVLAPFTYNTLWPRLQASAQGAATQCVGTATGQAPGTSCGRRWYQTSWDGYSGLGEQMSAMSAFHNLLIHSAKAPLTQTDGGTSKGDASAGNGGPSDLDNDPFLTSPITAADKFGASVLTIFSIGLAVGGTLWMSLGT